MRPAVLLTLTRGIDRLASALLDRADLEIVTLYDATLDLLRSRGIPHLRLMDFLPRDQVLWAAAESERRAASIERGLADASMRRQWPPYAEDEARWDVIRERTAAVLHKGLCLDIVVADAVRRCAAETDLRLIVVHQDISNEMKIAIQLGHRLGIPTLHTLHGYPYGAVNAINLCEGPASLGRAASDALAVFSDDCRQVFESLGVPRDRIVVTGNFEWDAFGRPPRPAFRREVSAAIGLDRSRPVIVYALTYTHRFSRTSARYPDYVRQTTDAVLAAFADLSRRHPDWQFVLRPHPNDADAPKDLPARAQQFGLRDIRVDVTTSAWSCAAVADVLVCTQSNLGIECVIAGKPVVNCVIDAFGKEVFDEGIGPLFRDEDAVISVRRPDAIAPAIEAALTDPETRRQFLEKRPATARRFNGPNDGKATERLCAHIVAMVERGTVRAPELDRFPDFEQALASVVPQRAQRVLVVGRAARFAADMIRHTWPTAQVDEARQAPGSSDYDVLVLADPVPHSGEADGFLEAARDSLRQGGAVIAAFQHGASYEARDAFGKGKWVPPLDGYDAACCVGQYSWPGVELVLARCNLAPEEAIELLSALPGPGTPTGEALQAWVVRARVVQRFPGPPGRANQARRDRACAANARGEDLFAHGDFTQAALAFASAIAEWDREALFLNNLGTTLHALGQPEEAWRRLLEALHLDPDLQAARDNLRLVAAALGRTQEAERLLRVFGSDPTSA